MSNMVQLKEYLLRYNVSPLGHTGLAVVVAAGRSQAENLLKAQGYYNAAKYTYNIEYCVLINNTDTFTSPALLDETIPIKGDQGPMGPRGYTGATGKQGIPGNPGKDGIDGIGISSTSVTYGVSNSVDSLPKSWTSSIPEVKEKSYLWTKIIFHYTNGEQKTIYSYTKQGYEGAKGESVTITNIQYSSNSSDTEIPDGLWVFDITLVKPNLYIWSKITFNDGSVLYNKIRQGQDGQTGPRGPKGDPGDPLTWDKMTLEQQESIKNEIEDNVVSEIETKTFPKLTAGFADNLIGRGEATAEEFTYRPTNGKDPIEDEVARVTKIKGNSVVWNQGFNTSSLISYDYLTVSKVDEITFELNGTTEDNLTWIASDGLHSFIASHKVYVYAEEIGGEASINYYLDNGWGVVFSPNTPQILDIGYTDSGLYIRGVDCTFNNLRIRLHTIDLTKMFGAGNEPTTVEEFYARIPSGIDINAYNEGEIISLNTEAIKTVGFNQWDEQWELGIYDTDNGKPYTTSTNIRCKDAIKALKNTTYYGRVPIKDNVYLKVLFYDEQDNYIGFANSANESFTTPVGCCFLRLFASAEYGTKYNNDICLNLSHTGWKNGTYEPYREFTRELSVIKKYFPNGMKKAGNAFDSIEWDSSKQKWVAVQRIGVVDLGDLYWEMLDATTDRNALFYADIHGRKNGQYEILCAKYITKDYVGLETDKVVFGNLGANNIYIVDTDYSNATAFKSAMQGVMLYYELAEPIVTEIEDEYLNFDYDVEDFGTEEALSSVPSAPFSADIIYKFNAVDSIRQNRLDIKELQELVISLQSELMQLKTTNNEAAIN